MDKSASQRLVALLISQHRALQAELGSAAEAGKGDDPAQFEATAARLSNFDRLLQEHLRTEDERFYQEYLSRKKARGEELESTLKFIEEMRIIAAEIRAFLDRFRDPVMIERSADAFQDALSGIIKTLNLRIETEEEGVYDFFLALGD